MAKVLLPEAQPSLSDSLTSGVFASSTGHDPDVQSFLKSKPRVQDSSASVSAISIGHTIEERRYRYTHSYRDIISRLSCYSNTIIIGGTLVILFSICSLAFLWFLDADNNLWHKFATKAWINGAVTLTAQLLQYSIVLQAGVMTSIVAAILLEKGPVLAHQLAAMSTIRNVNDGPLGLAAIYLRPRQFRGKAMPWSLIIATLMLITVLCQFTSTVLVSDLDLSSIPGDPSNMTVTTNFRTNSLGMTQKILGGSGWLQKPKLYPVFAEYAEPPESSDAAISDTGTLLRAFLPFQDQQTRRGIHTYSGRATVVDTRVACMRPQLTDARLHSVTDASGYYAALTATASTTGSVKGFNPNITLGRAYPFLGGASPVGCLLQPLGLQNLSSVSLCQLDQPGGLFSAFGQMGSSYMILNLTSGNILSDFFISSDNLTEITSPGLELKSLSGRDEWLDLEFPVEMVSGTEDSDSYRISVTVCYTGFDSADLPVTAVSKTNRTEPEPKFSATSYYSFDAVRRQLGQRPDGTWTSGDFEGRGILELQKLPSWNPNTTQGAYVRPWGFADWLTDENFRPIYGPLVSPLVSAAKFEGPEPTGYEQDVFDAALSSPVVNYTAFLNDWGNSFHPQTCRGKGSFAQCGLGYIVPDVIYTQLAQEIFATGGDVAHMLSSLFTVLAGSAYYDQLVLFDDETEIERSMFVLTLVPTRCRGFVAVVVVTTVHLVLLAFCACTFASKTSISQLNNAWQTHAQLSADPELQAVLAESALASDQDVVEMMAKATSVASEDGDSDAAAEQGLVDTDRPNVREKPMKKALSFGPYSSVRIAPSTDGSGTEIVALTS